MTDVAEVGWSEQDARVREGLTSPSKWLPMSYLYDGRGSELYERITRLPEYYLTRVEAGILERHAEAIVDAVEPLRHVVELGSGSSRKTRILLQEALGRHAVAYHPIDISATALAAARDALRRDMPRLEVAGHVGDYLEVLPRLAGLDGGRRLVLFLGSSIGNYDADDAAPLLGMVRRILRPGDRFLLGADHVKDPRVLEAAYDDAQGVTAAFNLNLLHRLNREHGADFDLARWRHRAWYDAGRQRVEMHLESLGDQHVRVPGLGVEFRVRRGETIHTETCRKYTARSLAQLAAGAGMRVERRWVDDGDGFSVNLLAAA